MSLRQLIMNELSDYYRRPSPINLYNQNFGLGLLDDDFVQPMGSILRSGYLRPWRSLSRPDSGVSSVQVSQNEFCVNLDVQQFKPEELNVKVADGFIIVEGKHEERSDEHGFVSRQFTRRYKLPEDAQVSALASTLSSDGVLTIKAPKKTNDQSRAIPITQTNTPAIKPEVPKEKQEVKVEGEKQE